MGDDPNESFLSRLDESCRCAAFSADHELVDPSFDSILWKSECFRHSLVVSVCDVCLLPETPDDST